MDQKNNRNLIKVILWSIIPIAVGITFSGFVVRAFTDGPDGQQLDAVEADVAEAAPKGSGFGDNIVAYLQKIKNIAGEVKGSASTTLAKVDFNDILYPPKATYHLKDKYDLPDVGAAAYVVADVDTGEIILEKNSEKEYPIASVTKLMTALVSLEDLNQSDTAKVSSRALATLGDSGHLFLGEKIKISDLIYPLLLVSSNDAAEVLAEHDGRDNFMSLMNEKARDIGMTSTNYEDPSGLSANNYSTAKDLFALAYYLFNNHRTVFNITTLDRYSLGNQTWSNIYVFSRRDDFLGGKTGYTDRAKRTGVALFSIPFEGYDNRHIAIILLRTDNRTADINTLLDYLRQNVYLGYEKEYLSANPNVTLGFVGDIMMDRGVKTSVYQNFDGKYGKILSEAKRLASPDIMFANLEGPISDKGKNVGSKYSFRFEPEVASTIKDAGIDIVSFANNHVGDWSTEAFLDTMGRLSENNILFTGAGEDYAAVQKPTIIERNGVKIGYLGMSDVGPEWIAAGVDSPGILLAGDKNLKEIVAKAKESVDVLVVSVHWGVEYEEHTKRQETLAKQMIDAGADIVVGHHPHVAQDVEEYKDGLIIYSLGNFVFDQYFSDETMQGMYAEVVVDHSGLKSHEETIFKINDKYQPLLDLALGTKPDFARGACPLGNSDNDLMFFDSNKENSVQDYIPEGLVEIRSLITTKDNRSLCLTEEAAKALLKMSDDAKKEGLNLVATSAFRSFDTQKTLYDNNRSSTNPSEDADSVAMPGHSEHQLGTTVDLSTPEIGNASASEIFGKTDLYKWMEENAADYGFVMSYPAGADTGYVFEPWHWRYLGTKEAKEIKSKNLTIQEYLEE